VRRCARFHALPGAFVGFIASPFILCAIAAVVIMDARPASAA